MSIWSTCVVYHLDDPGYWVLCGEHAKRYPDNPTSLDMDGEGTPAVGVEHLLERGCDECNADPCPDCKANTHPIRPGWYLCRLCNREWWTI